MASLGHEEKCHNNGGTVLHSNYTQKVKAFLFIKKRNAIE